MGAAGSKAGEEGIVTVVPGTSTSSNVPPGTLASATDPLLQHLQHLQAAIPSITSALSATPPAAAAAGSSASSVSRASKPEEQDSLRHDVELVKQLAAENQHLTGAVTDLLTSYQSWHREHVKALTTNQEYIARTIDQAEAKADKAVRHVLQQTTRMKQLSAGLADAVALPALLQQLTDTAASLEQQLSELEKLAAAAEQSQRFFEAAACQSDISGPKRAREERKMGDKLPEYPSIKVWRSHDGADASIGQHQQSAHSAGSIAGATAAAADQRGIPVSRPVANIGLVDSPKLYESPKASTQAFQRHGFSTSAGGLPPTIPEVPSAATPKHYIAYGNRWPLRKDASWFAMMVALFYLAVVIYYLYVRVRYTLDMKDKWYSICVLIVELIGITSVIPYAAINVVHTHPTGSAGLPIDDGFSTPDKKFVLRVLVPCYKESLATVSATITAAMEANLPPGARRMLYLCDDGKDPEKQAWLMQKYGDGRLGEVHYITGRSRAKGEINGKSANLNNVLKNVVYSDNLAAPGKIPLEEVLVVFDADMQAKKNFFCKILEVMTDESVSLCLSPQGFSNVNPAIDIYNNNNQQFWEYVLPGLDALGYIACTGTNFCLRARALGLVGWFPEYCITEDYALSMELKAAGFKGAYLAEYLAVGEAPEELRNVLRQRSRWTKGHMQLPFLHKLLYNNGTWSYFCTVITTWTFLLVPFLSLMFEIQPVRFGKEFALAATLYLTANFLVQNYFHVAEHMRGIWMANISNYLLSFTYAKAITNTLLAKLHIKNKAGFKPTEKTGAGGAIGPTAQLQSALLNRLTSLTRRFNQATLPQLYQPQSSPTGPQKAEDECIPDKIFMFLCLSICLNTLCLGLHQVYVFRTLTAWLCLPMLWAIYNAVPPCLFFGYLFASTDTLHNMCFWLQLVQMLCGLGAVGCLWFVAPVVYHV
eukprot:gene6654-6879_t